MWAVVGEKMDVCFDRARTSWVCPFGVSSFYKWVKKEKEKKKKKKTKKKTIENYLEDIRFVTWTDICHNMSVHVKNKHSYQLKNLKVLLVFTDNHKNRGNGSNLINL